MANQNKSQNSWDKAVAWYASHSYAVTIVYSLGAAVVIIGALFKILHWPGASYVLMVGMFTEAFLFTIGIFEKPHASYHWENVFPQLVGHETKELVGGNGMLGMSMSQSAGMSGAETLPETELKALKDGIQKLGKTAEQLASIGEVADATAQLKKTMTQASQGLETAAAGITDNLGKAGKAVEEVAAGLGGVVSGTKTYAKGIEDMNAHLASINSVYELQLKDLNAQTAAFRTQTEKVNAVSANLDKMAVDVQHMQTATAGALEASKQYQTAQQKLAQQVADLNKVYGNMLNALA